MRNVTIDDLKKVLFDIAIASFGPNVKYRFNPDTFPYTDPSLEMEVDKDGNDEKLGVSKVSYAYRITYRSIDKTLTGVEVNALHSALETATVKNFGATIR